MQGKPLRGAGRVGVGVVGGGKVGAAGCVKCVM